MKMVVRSITVLFLTLTVLTGCTTAMYTAPKQIVSAQNQYEFTIEVGGFTGGSVVDKRAIEEINQHMNAHGYKRYKIIHRKHIVIPSMYKYIVQFYK